jgi:hypothetical protein
MSQSPDPKVSPATEQMKADIRITSTEGQGVPREIAEAADNAGAQHTIGHISWAGQYASGEYTVAFNPDSGGGYSSMWPLWAFALAKDALLGDKKVSVSWYNSTPVGSNLHNVIILGPDFA